MGTVFMIFFSHQLDVLLRTHKTTHQDVRGVSNGFSDIAWVCFVGTTERHGKNGTHTNSDSGNHHWYWTKTLCINKTQWRMMSRIEPHFECRCTVKAKNVTMPCMMTTGVCPECSGVREKYRGGIFSWGLRMVTKQLTRKKLVHNLIYESILLVCYYEDTEF